jgi:predicted NodU family carbamoyl transferase
MDMAASIQKVTEEIMIKLAKSIRNEYGIKNLCLAGGVALNCVANGKILEEKFLIKFGFTSRWRCRWIFGRRSSFMAY